MRLSCRCGRLSPVGIVNMPQTRQPARSSFTFEIKRANRRTPEVVTTPGKAPSGDGASLADQVFGMSSGQPPARENGRNGVTPPSDRAPDQGLGSPAETNAMEAPSPRRVLPDLRSADVDPVAERLQHLEAEQAARRKTSRGRRKRVETKTSGDAPPPEVGAPDPVPTAEALDLGAGNAGDQPQVGHSRVQKRNAMRVAAKRAEREGRPVPRLPAGQRWKRRLPKACW
jgi:hypothetical protein